MTSISRSEHEKMQLALRHLDNGEAGKMEQELAAAHAQFVFHVEAARQSVALYEKHYKAARALLLKTVRKQKKEVVRKIADGVIQGHLVVFLLLT